MIEERPDNDRRGVHRRRPGGLCRARGAAATEGLSTVGRREKDEPGVCRPTNRDDAPDRGGLSRQGRGGPTGERETRMALTGFAVLFGMVGLTLGAFAWAYLRGELDGG